MALMHFVLRITALMTLLMLSLLFAARVLGGVQSPNPSMAGFEEGCDDQPQSCWYGVVPGVTTEAEIGALLAFMGEPELTRSIFSRDFSLVYTLSDNGAFCRAIFELVRGVVVRGELVLCAEPDFRVGDLALLLGGSEVMSLPPDELIYGSVSINAEGWPTPYSRITHINLLPADARFRSYAWHGFLPQNRYCQFVPDYPMCR
jgi:hypothetical protein